MKRKTIPDPRCGTCGSISLGDVAADREEHEHRIRQALDHAQRRKPPSLVCCIVHGDEEQCHDTFVERLKESTLRAHFRLPDDQPVKRYHLFFPSEIDSPDELGDRFRVQLVERLRLPASADETQIAQALTQTPYPILIYSELAVSGRVSPLRMLSTAFLAYWNNLHLSGMRQPLLVCLGVVYRRGSGFWGEWQASRLNKIARRQLQSLELAVHERIECILLPELRNLTQDDADNWLQATIADFQLRQELRAEIRKIFQRIPQISMERWRQSLQALV